MIFGNWLLWFTLFVNFLHFYYVVNFDFLPSGNNPINSGFSVRIISSILVFCIEHLHFKTKTIVFLNDLSFTFVVYLSEPKSGVHFRLFDVIAELWRLVVTLWFREFFFFKFKIDRRFLRFHVQFFGMWALTFLDPGGITRCASCSPIAATRKIPLQPFHFLFPSYCQNAIW